MASEFVQHTNRNVFLTGKAGTGKTTFLHQLREITPKRIVVVAPTGVAAMNAGGVTIHSFFQLGFAPAIPGSRKPASSDGNRNTYQGKFRKEKIKLIKCIDLLVIDEISMVRADVLDAMDEVLRQYRNHYKPFGGVQMLMIGDLHQLSPVVRENDWEILRPYYKSLYFFDSHALQKSNPVTIELKEIFRQSDAAFIGLLNKVRENAPDLQTINTLNKRYIQGFSPPDEEGYITLTTHNHQAAMMNREKLDDLKGSPFKYQASVTGEFPPHDFPTESALELKLHAQVMFVKNDPLPDKQYFNGKIGKISRLEEDMVYVKCPGDDFEITVEQLTWENKRYSLNDTTKEITEEVAGTFSQLPLKLAWAITIHKSQGLTFDKVIIDAQHAFASGQVYVALSRCRSFEGIVLNSPISQAGIITDKLVMKYTRDVQENEPDQNALRESRFAFQVDLICELFDFRTIRYRTDRLLKLLTDHRASIDAGLLPNLSRISEQFEKEVIQVSGKFITQLRALEDSGQLPEENPALQARMNLASDYFLSFQHKVMDPFLENFNLDIDNQEVKKELTEAIGNLQRELFIKSACLKDCKETFNTSRYIRKKSDADVDFKPSIHRKSKVRSRAPQDSANPELYRTLVTWRDRLALENGLPHYMILPQKSIRELVSELPATRSALKLINGIGPTKLQKYGADILNLIQSYCLERNQDQNEDSQANLSD